MKLGNIGHRLKGASDVLKVSQLSGQSRALEQAGKNGDLKLADKLARQIIQDIQDMTMALDD